jgi:hypothetical protein
MCDARLALARLRDFDLAVLQNLGPAERLETDGSCHDI